MTVTLKVEGMSCNHCVMHVTNALNDVDGVNKAVVSLVSNSAIVDYDESKANVSKMATAVAEVGYTLVE